MKRAIVTATAAVLLVVPLVGGCKESTEVGASPSNSNVLPPVGEVDNSNPAPPPSDDKSAGSSQNEEKPGSQNEEQDKSGGSSQNEKYDTSSPYAPDVCAAMSEEKVTELTGKQVAKVTKDAGGESSYRYCRWEFTDGKLLDVVAQAGTKELKSDEKVSDYVKIDGLGDAANNYAGSVNVLTGSLLITVSRTDLATRKKVAAYLVDQWAN